MKSFFDDAREWAEGRLPFLRLVLLIYLGYAWVRHLGNPMYGSWFDMLNLGIHELGHFVFMPFGRFLEIAGGSIFQCLVPVISIFIFYRQRDYFAIAISFGWLSTNFFDVATYIADARYTNLPLVSPFGACDVVHDWNWLLSRMGMLKSCWAIARWVRIMGSLSMLICLLFGGWLVWCMFRTLKDNRK